MLELVLELVVVDVELLVLVLVLLEVELDVEELVELDVELEVLDDEVVDKSNQHWAQLL